MTSFPCLQKRGVACALMLGRMEGETRGWPTAKWMDSVNGDEYIIGRPERPAYG